MEEQLGVAWELTADKSYWLAYDGPKINYSESGIATKELRIHPHPLLQERGVVVQQLSINRWKHSTILFYNQPGAKIPFDVFAAGFYLLSRYEEYLPHVTDHHGRYKHEQSVAAQFSFLQEPVVDQWIFQLRKIIEQFFDLKLPVKQFSFKPTYDIDIAWKYLHKGQQRQWGGVAKDFLTLKWPEITRRFQVLMGKRQDPFDSFDWLDKVHFEYNLQPIYFMLLGQESAEFDKNAHPRLPEMQQLMQKLASQYSVGIHPSYQSHTGLNVLQSEIKLLSSCIKQEIVHSRQHYIKFSLPKTYERLITAGIQHDYSMGYATLNGFRAGTSNDFLWYDLKEEMVTHLRIHPFVFMDATSIFYAKHTTAEAWMEWERLWHAVKKVDGTFISIWHNYILGTDKAYKGWPALYLKCLEQQ